VLESSGQRCGPKLVASARLSLPGGTVERQGSTYVHEKEVVSRAIAGELVIVPVRKGVGELDAIFTLDNVGSRIWELLAQPIAGERLVEVVCSEYEVPAEQARRDVDELLGDLLDVRLIRVHAKG
jgi:hypothetical protein